MKARGEKINVSPGPSEEIAGLKKMKMNMMMMMMKTMTPGSQDSRVWEFSYEALKVHRGPLGLCIGIWTSGVFWLVSKVILAVLVEFEAVLYEDQVRFHSGHPYIDRLPTV